MTDAEIKKTSDEISTDKIKAIYPHIVVSGDVDKPYYSIQWYDIEKKTMFDGYASYELKFVREWLQENFEVVETDIDNLINRQQADNERLKKLLAEEEAKYNEVAKRFYKAGVKELAKRLKDYYINHKRYKRPYAHTMIDFLFNVIDDLVAELTGDTK